MNRPHPEPLIGIIDDDPIVGESLIQRLRLEGYKTTWWQSGEEALLSLQNIACRVLVCDIRLPDLDGEQLFRRALPLLGATPVIFITAFAEVEQAVRLIRAGADDYLIKPFDVESLLSKIAKLSSRELIAGSNVRGREVLSASAAMHDVATELRRVADMVSPVLLLGETGIGKEVAARQLHEMSARRDQPFVVVNCATIPIELAESEMFGHERGAVRGTRMAQVGLVESTGAGTLFLDEVSTLHMSLQGKLLRLLEDGTYRRVGGPEIMEAQCRVVSSSNADLLQLVTEGRFRSDLLYRLNAIELHIPPLRSRRDDIIPLSEHLIAMLARDCGCRAPSLSVAAMSALCEYDWPGNIRELRNRLARAVTVTAGAPQIQAGAIFPQEVLAESPDKRVASLAEVRARAERLHIEQAIRDCDGEIAKAAGLLGISRTTLWEKMRKLRIS